MNLLALFRNRPDQRLNDVLIAHADAVIAGNLDREALLAQYDFMVRSDVETLMDVAERMHQSLPQVVPSDQFVKQLGIELRRSIDDESLSLLDRIRYLPPGIQLVAGIGGATLTAGLVLIASRSMPDALEFWRNRRTATA